jgi:flagellar protein FliL
MTEEERQMLEEMGDDSGGGGGKKKKLIRMGMLGGIILIQVIAAWSVAQFLILPRLPGDPTAADSLGLVLGEDGEPILEEEIEVEEEIAPEDRERGTILMMEQVVVNLIGIEGTHFLQVTAGLEYSEKKLEAEIGERMPELRDLLIDHLSSRNIEDVINREGRELVKSNVLKEFNRRLKTGDLINIYFSDFVVQ